MSKKTYLRFDELGHSASSKTRIWAVVRNVQWNVTTGIIKWYAPWRRYAFFPEGETLYDAGCLTEIAAFLERRFRPSA
jgi:hypothetical protein